jgi:hypothetical protein
MEMMVSFNPRKVLYHEGMLVEWRFSYTILNH